ncbi:unnamed protein product, partial [marine sediment metagenome]
PDRVDALVWAFTELMLESESTYVISKPTRVHKY